MHAPFPPSAAKRWMTCPGSVALSASIPEPPSSEYADDGTRLHDLAASHLQGNAPAMSKADYDLIVPYLVHCGKLATKATCYFIEKECKYSEDIFGTADFIALTKRVLDVTDLKTGRGVQVSPEGNEQLLTYAWLALGDPSIPINVSDVDTVRLTIAQPSIDGPMEIKQWECSVEDVLAHGARVVTAMVEAGSSRAPLVPGEHCRWCRAKPSCPALQGYAVEATRTPALANLTPVQMSEWLDKADLLQTFIDGLREVAHEAVRNGVQIPGYALKPKRATRSWANELAVLEYARDKRIKIFQEPKLMSPAMAEKAYPKGLPEPIKREIVSVSSGTNLVKSDKPAEPVEQGPVPLDRALSNLIYRV